MLRSKKQDIDKAASIILDAGGKVVGRTRLQKIAFLLELSGLGEGFDFEYRHYGPYSEQLADAVSAGALVGLISEEERATNWGGTYSIFTVATKAREHVPTARLELIAQAAKADPVALEMAATAAFLAAEGERDAWGESARRKPEKASRLEDAKSLYVRLGAISTPVPLPAIPLP